VLCLALTCAPASAHQRLVGVIQAQGSADNPQVTVLLKLDVRALMTELKLGEIADDDPRLLVTDNGRHEVLHLLRRTHALESWSGVCERDKIERYELTPSGAWLDVQIQYRCPTPMHYVQVRLDTLLDEEGHRIDGHFDASRGPEKVLYNRRARRHFLLFDEVEPIAIPVPQPPAEVGNRAAILLHPELWLLVLALAGAAGPRRRRTMPAVAAWILGCVSVGAAGALGAQQVPAAFGVVGLVVVGGVAARGLILRETRSLDIAVALLGAVFVGASAARDADLSAWGPWGPWVFAALASIGMVGLALPEHAPRWRRALGFSTVALVLFLVVGEAFRLVG
jgi:hypothetical protein